MGPMNEIVRPVTGGMEDWAYAASWDNGQDGYSQPCEPTEFGGCPREKTEYTTDQLRTFNILFETADRKAPYSSELGATEDLLMGQGGEGDGHVPRNIRLMVWPTHHRCTLTFLRDLPELRRSIIQTLFYVGCSRSGPAAIRAR